MSNHIHKKHAGWTVHRGSARGGFMAGMSSALTIGPRGTFWVKPFEADARALRDDMYIIGEDLYSSVKDGPKKTRNVKAAG